MKYSSKKALLSIRNRSKKHPACLRIHIIFFQKSEQTLLSPDLCILNEACMHTLTIPTILFGKSFHNRADLMRKGKTVVFTDCPQMRRIISEIMKQSCSISPHPPIRAVGSFMGRQQLAFFLFYAFNRPWQSRRHVTLDIWILRPRQWFISYNISWQRLQKTANVPILLNPVFHCTGPIGP